MPKAKPPAPEGFDPNVKYGNEDWKKKHPPDRHLTKAERFGIVAAYQYRGTFKWAAKYWNLTPERVQQVIDEESEKDTSILTSKRHLKIFAMAMREYGHLLIDPEFAEPLMAASKTSPLGLAKGGQYAQYISERALEVWEESKGGQTSGDLAEIQAEIDAIRERRGRLERPGNGTASATPGTAEGTDTSAETVGVDAG